MTFWLDAHLGPDLAAWMGSRFKIIVKDLREIGLRDADDAVIIAAARRLGQIVIVTKDGVFVEEVRRTGSPPQMLWLRCGNLSTLETQTWLSKRLPDALKWLEAGEGIVELD
jgi:predicted nuclease of predicted toxin-antitoxin system